jgi:hypothetical protein
MKQKFFIAYFDCLGFECIIDLTEQDKKAMWDELAGNQPRRLPVGALIMRAKANPQRFPEIWTFQSELSGDELDQVSIDNPQELANLIRENGTKVWVTPKHEEVIK